MTTRKHIILAIDGGGIRGLIPLRILETLEARMRALGKAAPLHRYIDMMAGSSSAAMIVAGLAAPKPDDRTGAPAASIEDLRRFFEVDAREVFRRPSALQRLVANPLAPFDERYDVRPLERLLKEQLGWTSIASALTTVVLPAYDIEAREAVVMTNGRQSDGSRPEDYYIWQAVRAAMASPAMFEPMRAERLGGEGGDRTLINGGVVMNNPTLAAYMEARKLGWAPEDIMIVSLGTGATIKRGHRYEEAVNWGPLGWLSPRQGMPLLSSIFHGQSTTVAYQSARLLPDLGVSEVLRLDGDLPEGSELLDNTRPGNIIELNGVADRIIRDNTLHLDRLAEMLIERDD